MEPLGLLKKVIVPFVLNSSVRVWGAGDAAQDLARVLSESAHQLASLKGEANAHLRDPNYDTLRHHLEDAHAGVEAAAVEARRRVRLNEGRER